MAWGCGAGDIYRQPVPLRLLFLYKLDFSKSKQINRKFLRSGQTCQPGRFRNVPLSDHEPCPADSFFKFIWLMSLQVDAGIVFLAGSLHRRLSISSCTAWSSRRFRHFKQFSRTCSRVVFLVQRFRRTVLELLRPSLEPGPASGSGRPPAAPAGSCWPEIHGDTPTRGPYTRATAGRQFQPPSAGSSRRGPTIGAGDGPGRPTSAGSSAECSSHVSPGRCHVTADSVRCSSLATSSRKSRRPTFRSGSRLW